MGIYSSRTAHAPLPAVRPRGAIAAFALLMLLSAASDLAGQRGGVQVSDRRLARIVPDSLIDAPIPRISSRGVDTTRLTASGLMLQQGTLVALRTGEGLRAVPGPLEDTAGMVPEVGVRERYLALPFRLLTPDQTGTGVWVLRPIYKVANRLRWDPDSSTFRGALFIAIEDSLRRRESRPLPTPVRFQLLAEASLTPERIELAHTNLPLQRVDLVARNVSDSLRVQIVPEFDVNGTDVWLPVEPSLVVEAPPRIQGWGVGTARVIVRVIGASGRRPAAAGLSSSAGELETIAVAIGDAGTGTTRLRSGGVGPATITASAPGFGDARATVEFVWPYVFFVAALSGGLFGGLGAAAHGRKARHKARWGEHALKGVFTGVIAAVAWYALEVNLLQLDPGIPRFNELGVFAFAALGGYFGIPRTIAKPSG